MRDWNGVSFLPFGQPLPAVEVASDASGSWRCGMCHSTHWFQVQWDDRLVEAPIVVKERFLLFLVLIYGVRDGRIAWFCVTVTTKQ